MKIHIPIPGTDRALWLSAAPSLPDTAGTALTVEQAVADGHVTPEEAAAIAQAGLHALGLHVRIAGVRHRGPIAPATAPAPKEGE